MLCRVLLSTDMITKKIAYLLIVRHTSSLPLIYGILAKKKQTKQLEKIPNNALRFVFNIKGLTSFSQLRKDAILNLHKNVESLRDFLFLLDAL